MAEKERRKELYSDLDKYMGDLKTRDDSLHYFKMNESTVSKYYGKWAKSLKREENSERPEDNLPKIDSPPANAQPIEQNEQINESSEPAQDEKAKSPSFFARLLSKIGIESGDNANEEPVSTQEAPEQRSESSDLKDVIMVTKELIKRLPDEELSQFTRTEAYQKLKELSVKYK